MDEQAVVTAAEVARLAGVGRAAVSNWRRRYDDFPRPVDSTDSSPSFRLVEVYSWLRENGRIGSDAAVELAWQAIEAAQGDAPALLGRVGEYLRSASTVVPEAVRVAVDALVVELGAAEAFEQLCARYVVATSRQLAVTPAPLAALMVELAVPGDGPVLDPACGTGSLLREVAADVEVLGQELESGLAALASARLAFSHSAAHVMAGDSLRSDGFVDTRAEAVVCNPPFNVRAWGHEDLQFDARWTYGLPAKGESELAWVQHCLARVRPGGRVVIVLPPGVASRRSGRPVRAALIRRGVLRSVISLPAGAVAPAHLRMQLWVLTADEGSPAEAVRFVDLCAGDEAKADHIGWAEIGSRLRRALRGDDDVALQRMVPSIDLLDDDVDLNPARYLERRPVLSAIGEDRDRFLGLLAELGGALPRFHAARESAPRTTIGELARQGALSIRHQTGALDEGDAVAVLTGRDVMEGRGPTGTAAETGEGEWLQPGDVVVPTVVARPAAFVIGDAVRALLGPGLQLLRVNPREIDPDFLAGALRSGDVTRVSASMSGRHRVDVRRVELPRLPLDEQRRVGRALAALHRFGLALEEAASLGRTVTQALTDAVVDGHLEPDGVHR